MYLPKIRPSTLIIFLHQSIERRCRLHRIMGRSDNNSRGGRGGRGRGGSGRGRGGRGGGGGRGKGRGGAHKGKPTSSHQSHRKESPR